MNAVNVPAPFLDQVGVGAHQITQFPNGLRRNKASFQETVTQEVGDPFAIFDVCFVTGNGMHMLRID